MKLQSAGAYLFADRIVVHGELSTPFGSFASPPYLRLARDAAAAEIGQAVMTTLESFREQERMPDVKAGVKSFHAGLGVKSNAQLQRGALAVSILRSERLEFHATHNGGTSGDKKGFQPIPGVDPLYLAVDASPAEIGAAR